MITKFKCKMCGEEKRYEFSVPVERNQECHDCNIDMERLGFFCPACGLKLVEKHEGFACKNSKCCMHFKLGRGWCYLTREEHDKRWMVKYRFDITSFENQKKWLKVKSEAIVRDNFQCRICNKKYDLDVHHILYQSEHPELSLDIENLMTLCIDCHNKMHENDKHQFRRTKY